MPADDASTHGNTRVSRNRSQLRISLAVLGIALALGALLMLTRPVLQPQASERAAIAVRVETARPRDIPLEVHSQGSVQPRAETSLVPEVPGRVVWISPELHPGGHILDGELLLRLQDDDYRIAVGAAEAGLMRARAEAEFARFEAERLGALRVRDLTSRSQAENAVRAQRVAESVVKEAEVALERARLDLGRTAIRAPFTGRVRSERVDLGQAVNRGDVLAMVYATDVVEIRLPITDAQLAYLDPALGKGMGPIEDGPEVRVEADYGGTRRVWQGRIVRTEAELDARSRMVHVVARVGNVEGTEAVSLPVGLFVEAGIRGQVARGVIALPRQALREGNRVLVIDAEDRLRWRDVTLLRAERERILVSGGLSPGERVCVSPLQIVVEGMRVRPVDDSPAPEA